MKQLLIILIVLLVAGVAYWFFMGSDHLSNTAKIGIQDNGGDSANLVPPALPE